MSRFFARFPGRGYVCAHRGARSIAPENTFLALEKARLSGADLWETDVQATLDGELVLFHDQTLKRTTDVRTQQQFSGRSPWRLADFTYPQLLALDLGSWFLSSDPFGTLAAGELLPEDFPALKEQRLPRVREVLEYCRQQDFPTNLEIKDQSGTPADSSIVGNLLELIKKTRTEDLVLISSFKHDYLRQLKQLNPRIATAALVEVKQPKNLLEYLRELGVDAYHPDQRITDLQLVKQLVSSGMRVNLWTLNDLSRAREYAAAGATFICTDWPQKMVADLPLLP